MNCEINTENDAGKRKVVHRPKPLKIMCVTLGSKEIPVHEDGNDIT